MQEYAHRMLSPSPSSNRLAYLDNMRAIAIVMVVGVHALSYNAGMPNAQKEIIRLIVYTISVPVFFFTDGFLFGRSVSGGGAFNYKKYIWKSIIRLLLPWIIFSFIYAFARYIFEYMGVLEDKLIIGATWQKIAVSIYGSVYAAHLYFLASLYLIRLLSPLIKVLFVETSVIVTFALVLLYFAAYAEIAPFVAEKLAIKGGQEPITHALWGLKFYLLGLFIFRVSEVTDLKNILIPAMSGFGVFLVLKSAHELHIPYVFQNLYLLAFFSVFYLNKCNLSLLNIIGENSMGIYLIHAPLILKGISLIINRYAENPICSYLVVLSFTFGLSLLLSLMINAIPYGSCLFGVPPRRINRAHAN